MRKIIFCILFLLCFNVGCHHPENDWFVIQQIDNNTFKINEPYSSQNNSSFLIVGEKDAILFDAGSGENKQASIKQILDSLTKQPITMLLSHFHFDHIGNIHEFRLIGLPEIDFLKERITADSILNLSGEEILVNKPISFKISKFLSVEKETELGNRSIAIYHTPGHADESITLIDHKNKLIFTGDLVYNGLLLIDDPKKYVESIDLIMKNSDPDYRIFGSHGKPEVDYNYLEKIKASIECYLAGDNNTRSLKQIDFFGTQKKVYTINGVSFIIGYSEVFLNDK